MPDSDILATDPYAEVPSFWQVQKDGVWAAVVALFTVALTVLSFPPFKMPEFAYAMLVPGIVWAYRRPPLKLYAGTMFAAQAVAWTILLGWLHHVTWVGLFLLGPVVGAWVGSWYLAAWWAMPRIVGRFTPVRLLAMLGLAGAWVLIEWSRTWLLGGFPWLPLAASQWERASILQVAAYTGAGGVSFVLVAMNLGFAAYAHRLFFEGATGLRRRSQEFLLALFLLLVCLSVQVQETFNRAHYTVPLGRVAFVQPDIPQEVKWDPTKEAGILDTLEKTTMNAALGHPDLILWPEAVTPRAVKDDARVRAWTEALVARAGSPVLMGSVAWEVEGESVRGYNGAFLIDPRSGLQPGYYAKRKLVPFGEFVPFRPVLGWLNKFVEIGDGDFTPGDSARPIVVPVRDAGVAFGPLICYEDTYPLLARASALAGADVLAVLTNNGWFGEGGAAYQHAAHAVLRAVETRRPVLRCGNAGWSGWIDEFGGIRAVLTRDADGQIRTKAGEDAGTIYFRGAATVGVTRDQRWIGRNSYYVEHGDWFVVACAGLALFGAAVLMAGGESLGPSARRA
ncbi:MAG TPA: apolipoprotein N-acyltransferase [Opitutaceae bacterium]|nr:apolipoprotein N-acyltransferase [Opitutaceae bacterium]